MSEFPTWVYYVGAGALGFTVLTALIAWAYRIGKWVERVNAAGEASAKVPEFMREILGKLDRIFDRLPAPQPVAAGSPLHLTEMGERIADALGAGEWAEEAAAAGWVRVKGKSPYDVQAAPRESCAWRGARSKWRRSRRIRALGR